MRYQNKTYELSDYRFRQKAFEINDVGESILSYIRSAPPESTLDQLISSLLDEYEIDETTLRGDACRFLERCIEKDVLINGALKTECDAVLKSIHEIQKDIPQLSISHFGHVVKLGGSFTPGCQSCARGRWAVLGVGYECNLCCDFCPYPEGMLKGGGKSGSDGSDETIFFSGHKFTSFRDLQFQFSLISDQFDAFAWVGGEPLLPLAQRKFLPLVRDFHRDYPSYHQWVYTNGTFATATSMQDLYDAGIRELRFNLAATNFSRTIIAHMKEARNIFPYVCLEIPMTTKTYEGLLANLDAILATGIDQWNLAEFIVGREQLTNRRKSLQGEGRLYNYRGFITSPVSSRLYTYEIIRRAARENWPVVINDCSNEYKYYKLSIQERRRTTIFRGQQDYWNNNYGFCEIDAFNAHLDGAP